MTEGKDQFIGLLSAAYAGGSFLKCTLSKPGAGAPEGLHNIYIRPVEIKKGPRLAFNYRYKTRDEVKNYTLEESVTLLEQLLGCVFLQADLLAIVFRTQDYPSPLERMDLVC